MKRYSSQQIVNIFEKVDFSKRATISQHLTVIWWAVFNTKKLYKFCSELEKGKHIIFAFEDVNE